MEVKAQTVTWKRRSDNDLDAQKGEQETKRDKHSPNVQD